MKERFLQLIEDSIRNYWDVPAFSDYKGETFYYRDVAEHIAKYHVLLELLGIKKGDKVALVGRNSSHWAMAFFGTLSYGAVIVPILHDFKPDNIHHIVTHSEAKILLCGDVIWENLTATEMPKLKYMCRLDQIFSSEPCGAALNKHLKKRDTIFQQRFKNFGPQSVHYHIEKPEELAVLSYTSGTTSMSKGVMLPYRSLWSNIRFSIDSLPYVHPGDHIVCMLPMAHMYGLAFEILNSFAKGCHVHFLTRTPSPKIIAESFATVKPILILAVPLIIEKIVRNKIFPILEKPHIRFLMKLPFMDKTIYGMIRKKMVEAFGGAFEEVVIGGAALNKDIESFLRRIRFPYTVGYGMTECGPLVSYSPWREFREGSVGRVVARMEVCINSKDPQKKVGEILVRGDNVMLGYYKNPEATKAVFMRDGWMNTGDLGLIDEEGNIFIKGRSKTMILGPSGQNIYPEEIEGQLNNMDYVNESLIVEKDGRLTALINPDWGALDMARIPPRNVEKLMQENIKELNKKLPAFSQITGIKLYQEEFDKTPKRSIKRYLYQ
ncbi:MAG: AMP-binding protein [Bacteroidales bacterium]|nr:AMP-binding protein [Bacteroidales bacterium]